MIKFILGMVAGIVLAMNVNLADVYESVEFEQKQVQISVPKF